MELNGNWKLQFFDVGAERDLEIASPEYIDYFWMRAQVPGEVHSTLLKHRLIEDPFYGHNDLKCRWVEEKVWWYRTTFEWKDKFEKSERLELIFEGLDTYATVYLNGVELGSTENMFISHTFDVTRELRKGKNVLAVKFDPIDFKVKDKTQYYWSGFSKQRIWTRKAQSHFGWDWGPRLVSAGIWKNVLLQKRKCGKIDSVFAHTLEVSEDQAIVKVEIDTCLWNKNISYYVDVKLVNGEDVITTTTGIINGKAQVNLTIQNPKLWWTHDLGEPNLYNLHVTLLADSQIVDKQTEQVGIRTTEVKLINDRGQHCFTFVLNGVEIFAKGSNWIPIDSFIASTPDERYVHLIKMAKVANMNMLRVWGGGIYEKDIFYKECNQQGILVWQDFMFACALYPDYNKNFMDNVQKEIVSVVKRLRNHPCLSIWCGNNENDWLYEALYSSGEITDPFYGEKIYHELMPELLEELDPTRLYWPSSPYGGNDHNSREQGDTHNWQVWHGNIEPRTFGEPQQVDYSVEGVSFKKFKQDTTAFASEFGMHASSNLFTLKSNIPEDQFYWGSEELAYRNKDVHHPKGILLMEGYTGIPENLDQYLKFSMLTQAEGLKFGIEHYRRNKSQTSGALIWQLNDCWPGTSWSLIDYYQLPKASYHYARKFFSPILYTLDYHPSGVIDLWGINDQLEEWQDELTFIVSDFYGKTYFSQKYPITINSNSTTKVASFNEKDILQGLDPTCAVIVIRGKSNQVEDNFYYFRDQKDIQLPKPNLQVHINKEEQSLTFTSKALTRMVTIEMEIEQLILEDNFFDLLPGEEKTIQIKQLENKKLPWETLSVSTYNDL
ncbi:beta galactosidase jelly roll domain-containing protein [Pullulanibacillus sp. KACC 23026]|uniref:beta-mannosidase n=1 Tax=Pullulanibacillus sp. KACC 23026 TaxID=3028315 RepID=UPI0023AEEB19|nr:glycoside hydrolase family 2 protein [Pullulanibacillus sp. KACC 23026]WEG13376.1 beta galactosidase jelly roll domain-containing protein [Pullulanibacillus sp. KACC 23026]